MSEKAIKKDPADIAEVLGRNPLFKGLEPFYIKDFLAVGEVRGWPSRTQIVTEGDMGDAVYFILSGKVNVNLYGEEGREIVVAILTEGDMFGEMSILDNKPRSANVQAITDLECFVVSKEGFLGYLSRHHRVYTTLLAYFTGRLREATRKIGGLALLDVCGRIAHTLIGMSKVPDPTKQKIIYVERPTHEELAAMIGSSREVVSRAIKKMSEEGYIKMEKDRVVLYMHA